MTRGPSRALVIGALLLVQIFFGLHYIAAKIVLASIPAGAWAVLRIVSAAAILLVVTAFMGKRWPTSPADHARLALYALFGVTINQVCFVEGLARTLASHSTVLNTAIPVATLLIAIVMRRERPTPGKLLGIALSLCGALYLVVHSGTSLQGGAFTGDLLTLANGLSYSIFLVISKPILSRYSSQVVTALVLGYGAIGIVLYGGRDLLATDLSSVPAPVWGWAAFVILFATVAAYMLNSWALKRVDSSQVALFIYVQPVIAAGLAVIVLGESITPHLVVAAALIFAGVFVAVALSGPSAAPRTP
ncbi:MAG TPA: DMT family transporter [Verrucomicrobiae bacterium]|nr:DMT family transporter [Verrucomicrobiae bacterium]